MENKRILYIEDSPEEWEPIVRALDREGILVDTVSTFTEALQKLRSPEAYSAVLIDLLLPVGNLPSALNYYVSELGNDAPNTGQALGAWLRKNKKDLDYAYFTVSVANFRDDIELQHENFKGLINKAGDESRPKQVANTIRTTFGWAA